MQNGEPTNQEILEAINAFSSGVDKKFDDIDKKFDTIGRVMATKDDIEVIRKEMATKADLGKLRSDMIDFIEGQNIKLRGDIVELVRKEDARLSELVGIQQRKGLLDEEDVQQLEKLRPVFPVAR